MRKPTQLDERLAFYARNKKWLDEWFRLRKEFCDAASMFYADLLVDSRPPGADVSFEHKGYYRRWRLCRSEWETDGNGDRPCIWLEWNQESTFADGHLTFGIRCDPSMPPNQAAFRRAIEGSHLTAHEIGTDSSSWRVFFPRDRMPPASGEYWKDLHSYRNDLSEFINEKWIVLANVIDRALE